MGRCGHPSHRPLDAEPWEASQGLEPTCHAAVEWLAATGAAVTLVAWPAHASPVVSTVFATDDAIGRFEELQHGGTLHLCRDRQGDLTHAEVVEGQSWAHGGAQVGRGHLGCHAAWTDVARDAVTGVPWLG